MRAWALTIAALEPLEKRIVETKQVETKYDSIRNRRRLISKTRTTGETFAGYIVECYAGDQLAKRDASSRKMPAAGICMRSI